MEESQLTFDDIGSHKDELYTIVTSIASELTTSHRDRSGDNCPTVTTHKTPTSEYNIKLPPKTTDIQLESLSDKYEYTVQSFSRTRMEDTGLFVFIVTVNITTSNIDSEILINFVLPAEEFSEEESDEERIKYEQFDFKKFIETELTD